MILLLRLHLRAARLAWPATLLVLLLQRTPLLRFFVQADAVAGGRVGHVLRAMLPAAVVLGTTHTLTGQSHWETNPTPPVQGTVGQELSVAFAFTGGTVTPESYSIVGTLPPGLSVPDATGPAGNLTLNSSSGGTVTGTPTEAGQFSVTLRAYDGPDRSTGTYGSSVTFDLTFNIVGGNSPPAFTTQPQSQTVAFGDDVTLAVEVTGSPTPTLQWRKDETNLPGATGSTLTLEDVTMDDAGDYDVVATNSEGSAMSNVATLTVTPPAAPTITTQPLAMRALAGSGAFFSVVAQGGGLSYQWRRDSVDLPGATHSSLFLDAVAAADEGAYSVVVSNPGGSVESNAVALDVVNTGSVRLINLSARAVVGTGDGILIPGFFIGGSGEKKLLVRTVGPKLVDLGVGAGSVLADPMMRLFRGSSEVDGNDDWRQFPDQDLLEETRANVFAFALTPSSQPEKDAAIVTTLPAGATGYTVHASGVGGTTGVGLVELFDADPANSTSRLINLSARAQVGTGSNVVIPGFFLSGNVAATLLIRASGPSLANTFGVSGTLDDPVMTLFRGAQPMASNDDWENTPNLPAMLAAQTSTFAFKFTEGAADAALLVSLNPGGYTVKVEGKNGTTGVALIELYLVGP